MTGAALVLALAVAAQEPAISVSVDRDEVLVGDIVTLTIRVEAEGSSPARIIDPPLSGFEVRGSRDATRVLFANGVPRRTVTRELRLVAVTPGQARIGPVRVERDGAVVESVAITVRVVAAGAAAASAVAPHVQAILDTLRPPVAGDRPMVEVLAVPDTVMLGEQLDLVTLAWFPREVRQQLRTPPTLTPPDVQGVWSYQQASAAGVVASRRVGAVWFDLYAAHQVAFPLTVGTITVGQATVSYVQPLSYSFLSRELQHEVQSESLAVVVVPQPPAGRPTGFSGAAGEDLAVGLAASQGSLLPGGAATVDVTVEGTGNVALWPEPDVTWPPGLRVYPSGVTIEHDLVDGRIAGRKRFQFLVIADSAGAHVVPGLSYPYFDTQRRRYAVASAPGMRLVAPPGTIAAPTRPLPPAPHVRAPKSAAAAAADLASWVWALVLLLPPALVLSGPLLSRLARPRRRRPTPREREVVALEALDHELRDALRRRLGDAADWDGGHLTAALRAAGVEASLAVHLTRVRDRLRQAVFGPPGAADPDELAAEVHEVLRALAGDTPGSERRQLIQAVVVVMGLMSAGTALAQGPRPEDLYAAGAFRAAADSFAARVVREPDVAAYWYNLGAAFYRLGEDGRAKAAWIRAARIAPRDQDVRRARRLLPADPLGARLAPVAPITPQEAALGAAALWLLGWMAVAFRRLRRMGVVLLVAAVAAAGLGWRIRADYRTPAAIVLIKDAELRDAPHAAAQSVRTLTVGDAVRVEREAGAWLLVGRDDARGWVLAGEVARL